MNRTVKIILIVIGGAIVLAVVAKAAGWTGQSKGVEVEWATVERRTLVETVSASGKIQPEVEVKLSSEVSGEIVELNVIEGQQVETGDVLVRINPDLYTAATNRAGAAVSSARTAKGQAEVQLVEAKKSFERSKSLHEQNVISNAEWEAAQRQYDVAKLAVESASYQLQSALASLNEAQSNLRRTTIISPMTGTVSALNVELGERVVGTAQMAGTEMLRIANLDNMEVLTEVNENDIVRVSLMDTATIEVDAYLGRKFRGVVKEIANSAKTQGTSVDQVTNFEVKVRILRSSYEEDDELEDQPFRPGMTATVDIQTNRKESVLAVPIQAVTVRQDTVKMSFSQRQEAKDSNDDPYEVAFVYDDGKARIKVVKTGIQDETHIEILQGLEEGEGVVTGPYEAVSRTLQPGDPVEKKENTSAAGITPKEDR